MPIGVANFEISNLHNNPSSPRMWWAEVRFIFDDMIDDFDVAHWVTIKVRVIADETVAVQELRQMLFQKAVQQLSRASQAVAGKTSQQLLDAAQTQILADKASNSYL